MFDSILRIKALAKKELLTVLKDPRARFSVIVPPIIQCLIFGYAATFDLSDIPYAVLDRDRTSASYDLLAKLDGSGVFHRVANLDRADDVKTMIDDRRALLVIQIDHDFERRLVAGQSADVQLIADGRNSNTGGTAVFYVGAIVDSFNSEWRKSHNQSASSIRVALRAWYNPNLETRWFMIPALIGTLTMMQTLLITAQSVAREREQGTFDQLLVTPFRPVEIMAGKALASMVIGTMQATTVLLIANLWFGIPFAGSFVTLYAGLAFFLLAAVGIGLLVSAFAANMQQAMLYSMVLLMPFILMSGLTTPISNMPKVLQYFTLINPLRYAIAIVHRIFLEGAGFGLLLPEMLPLAAIGVVTLSVSAWLFSQRLE